MHLYHAKIIAENLQRELEPFCEPGRCIIAGSIRRQKEEVKDIEIVCIPKSAQVQDKDLFGEVIGERTVIHPEFERIIRGAGVITKGKFIGRQMQVEMKAQIESMQHTIMLDMFMPQPHDYFRQLAIRTGSAEYSHRYIANAWVKRGWCGVNGDLRLIKECGKMPDGKWVLRNDIRSPTLPPVWKSEQEFFKWLMVPYLEPKYRNL